MNSDFKDLLKLFNDSKVRYLVVGGHAVMKYTEPRYTKDLDIWIDASPRNARAVFRALRDFGAPLANLTAGDFAREGTFYQMGRPPARIDILMSVAGLRFPDAWRRRVTTDFDGVSAYVISREDLLVNKRAAGRPQDLVDASNLEESERIARGGSREPQTPEERPRGRPRKPRKEG
jgi:hypothetical protein